jgi:hypothetical protein
MNNAVVKPSGKAEVCQTFTRPGQFPGQFWGSWGSQKGVFGPFVAYREISAKCLIY